VSLCTLLAVLPVLLSGGAPARCQLLGCLSYPAVGKHYAKARGVVMIKFGRDGISKVSIIGLPFRSCFPKALWKSTRNSDDKFGQDGAVAQWLGISSQDRHDCYQSHS